MNVHKTETWIGIIATGLIGIGLLWIAWREPTRLAFAQQAQLQTTLDEAMDLYAQNCSVCHGISGEGIGATPPLNNESLRQSDYFSLFKIIGRGLFGTAMPAWSKEDGGPLSDYQIGELVTLIQYGNWQETHDRVVNLGLAPSVPFTTQPNPTVLEQLSTLPQGDLLIQGVNLYAQQCVACHGTDGKGTTLAPALNDPLVQKKSIDELTRIISNGVPGTIMAGWQNTLNKDEIDALVTLITQWDKVPEGAIPAPSQPVPVTAESLALGKDLYAQNCSRCHGAEGQGTRRAPSLNVKGYLEKTNDAAIQQIITLGIPGTAMPSWGDRLSDAEIQAIVGFIRSWEPNAPEVALPARGGGGPWWKTNSSSGEIQGGGPPWMQKSNSSSPNSQYLPSGGSVQDRATNEQTKPTISDETQKGGPSLSQSKSTASQTTNIDWRAIILIAAISCFALILITIGISGLART